MTAGADPLKGYSECVTVGLYIQQQNGNGLEGKEQCVCVCAYSDAG